MRRVDQIGFACGGEPLSFAQQWGILLICLCSLAACANKPYRYQEIEEVPFLARAKTQTEAGLRVRVAVPGAEETRAIFGIPMYDRGIQPVWIEVTNGSEHLVRFALVGVDPQYFSPLEVPYMHRGGFSKDARREMDRRFDALAMPRHIRPGQTTSGFVFTHVSPGTKAVSVDVFSDDGEDVSFIFFMQVPGYVPDHAEVDFDGLYPADEVRDYGLDGLRRALTELPCCTTDRTGERQGLPYNVILVSEGEDVLHALLRAGWYETARPPGQAARDAAYYFFGREPDAVFRRRRSGPGGREGDSDRNEMRLWLAPMRVAGEAVWIAQATHFIGRATQIEQFFVGSRLDPDFDDGRDYMLQLSWYAQGLRKYAWLDGGVVAPLDAPVTDWSGGQYFSDGKRVVLWLSGDPISILETRYIGWDEEPQR